MHLTALAGELQSALKGEVKVNEPLSRHTTWRLGGPADLFYQPGSKEELLTCLNFIRRKGLPLHILGNGSNILVLDKGVRGLVLQMRKWQQVEIRDQTIWAAAGALMGPLLRKAADCGLGGLEFAAGIPATIGGAAVTNAGTPDGCIGDVVQGVEVISLQGSCRYLPRRKITYAYRSSTLRQGGIVAAVKLQLAKVEADAVHEEIKARLCRRRQRQPLGRPNAGSVFKNPPGEFAGQLIETIGAKGWQVGQAKVSVKHANFILNCGRATAADVLGLIDRIRERVYKLTGIDLELEIEIWGEGL